MKLTAIQQATVDKCRRQGNCFTVKCSADVCYCIGKFKRENELGRHSAKKTETSSNGRL